MNISIPDSPQKQKREKKRRSSETLLKEALKIEDFSNRANLLAEIVERTHFLKPEKVLRAIGCPKDDLALKTASEIWKAGMLGVVDPEKAVRIFNGIVPKELSDKEDGGFGDDDDETGNEIRCDCASALCGYIENEIFSIENMSLSTIGGLFSTEVFGTMLFHAEYDCDSSLDTIENMNKKILKLLKEVDETDVSSLMKMRMSLRDFFLSEEPREWIDKNICEMVNVSPSTAAFVIVSLNKSDPLRVDILNSCPSKGGACPAWVSRISYRFSPG